MHVIMFSKSGLCIFCKTLLQRNPFIHQANEGKLFVWSHLEIIHAYYRRHQSNRVSLIIYWASRYIRLFWYKQRIGEYPPNIRTILEIRQSLMRVSLEYSPSNGTLFFGNNIKLKFGILNVIRKIYFNQKT